MVSSSMLAMDISWRRSENAVSSNDLRKDADVIFLVFG